MRRWLFNLAAVVSLALCLATAAMWVRSRRAVDSVMCFRTTVDAEGDFRRSGITFSSDRGEIVIQVFHGPYTPGSETRFQPPIDDSPGVQWRRLPYNPNWTYPFDPKHSTAGFGVWVDRGTRDTPWQSWWMAWLPHWSAMAVWAILRAAWLIRWRRRRRRFATGCCAVCGYDLRATPDRCPECGHVPAEAAR